MPANPVPLKSVRVSRRFALGAGLAFAASPFVVSVASALGAPDAEATVRRFTGRIFDLIGRGGERQALRAALGSAIETHADVGLIGRLTLGRLWQQANEQQRAQYQSLFRSFMLISFSDRLVTFATESGERTPELRILGSQAVSEKDVVVRSSLARAGGTPLTIDWRLRRQAEGFAIIDLVVEGVSLLVTQRGEFASIVERESFDALLEQLRTRTEALA